MNKLKDTSLSSVGTVLLGAVYAFLTEGQYIAAGISGAVGIACFGIKYLLREHNDKT